ncbi:TlpA family protein disulfide reductase [Cohnella luojiensis]|uniref:Redoxin domain-containing protein n=1 Tax=Cohnella luojiensis TaxID=652876 RepID=A0A4Y8LPD5_9BACL|nr:redoxin domain-containing protein [Cohnella luojiensis]TFE19595.1 redoxin domain-containing protein [Cohnella luojiensis]
MGAMGQMPNLQVGTFVLNAELLVYLLAGVAGVLAVRFQQRANPEREKIISVAWDAVFIWIVLWKGSLLLFDSASVIDHPMSLLFFSGGVRGVFLASAVAIGYMGFRYSRMLGTARQTAAAVATMASSWVTAVYLAAVLLSDSAGGYSYVILGLFASLLIFLLSPSPKVAAQALSVLLVITMIASTLLHPGDGKSIKQDQLAPDFQLTDLNGNAVNLSDFRGQTVLMNFWATWCQVCKAEMPHVEKLYQNYKDQGVVVLSVNVTSQERNTQQVHSYVKKHDLGFPVVLDEAGQAANQYKVTAYPTTYLIDKSGVVRERYLGAISYESMKKIVGDVNPIHK